MQSYNFKKNTLILGSSSNSRLMLLKRLSIPFTTVNPDIDETPLPNEDARQLVKRLVTILSKIGVSVL